MLPNETMYSMLTIDSLKIHITSFKDWTFCIHFNVDKIQWTPTHCPVGLRGRGRDAVEHRCVSGGAVGAEAQDHALAHAHAHAQAHVAHAAGHVAQYRAPRGVGRPKLHLEEERSVVEWRSRQLSVVLDTKATYCSRFGKKDIAHLCNSLVPDMAWRGRGLAYSLKVA